MYTIATLELNGKADGAVRAVGEITTAAQGLKAHFDQVGQSAGQLTTELEKGGGASSMFAGGLESMSGWMTGLLSGGLLAGVTAGVKAYADELERAGRLAPNAGLAPLAQLGPQQLATARGLINVGTPEDAAAGITQAMEGASAADIAFMRAAAPTTIFGDIPGMEKAAKAYEMQYGGDLPTMIGKARAVFSGLPSKGLEQMRELSEGFGAAGIGADAGMALTGTLTKLAGGDASQATQFIRGGLRSGFFGDLSPGQMADPGKMIDAINAFTGGDEETLGKTFGRGVITAAALSAPGARADVERRFQAEKGAGAADAYAMLGTAAADPGLQAGAAQRATEGRIATEQEPRGIIRNRFLNVERQISYEDNPQPAGECDAGYLFRA